MSSEAGNNFFMASIADVFAAMLLGWKVFGHANLSWWWVASPYVVTLAIAAVCLIVLGVVKVFID